MNKFLSSLALPMFAFFIVQHNNMLQIVKRLDNGSLITDIIRVQSPYGETNWNAVDANTREMRMYKQTWQCAPGTDADKSNCKKANPQLQTAN